MAVRKEGVPKFNEFVDEFVSDRALLPLEERTAAKDCEMFLRILGSTSPTAYHYFNAIHPLVNNINKIHWNWLHDNLDNIIKEEEAKKTVTQNGKESNG